MFLWAFLRATAELLLWLFIGGVALIAIVAGAIAYGVGFVANAIYSTFTDRAAR